MSNKNTLRKVESASLGLVLAAGAVACTGTPNSTPIQPDFQPASPTADASTNHVWKVGRGTDILQAEDGVICITLDNNAELITHYPNDMAKSANGQELGFDEQIFPPAVIDACTPDDQNKLYVNRQLVSSDK